MMTPAIWTAIFPLPLHETFRKLQALGWRAFEISTEHLVALETAPDADFLIEKALAALREAGATAPQAHALLKADVAAPEPGDRKRDIDRLLAHLAIAARLGVRTVVIHPGGSRIVTTREERRRSRELNVEAFRRLGDVAGSLGMRIGLENLMSRGAASPPELLDLLDAIDHPALGVTLDTSHANAARLDVAQAVREFGPFLVGTHISDNNGSGDQHLIPGNGTIDWPAVMAAFRETPYDGLFNLEIPGERHPVPEILDLKLRHALNVARALLAPAG
jgi:sugar phosphate isomerase/epimerase